LQREQDFLDGGKKILKIWSNKMITIRSSLLAIALAISHSGIASAAATTYSDIYDAGSIKLGAFGWSSTNSDSWTFDITDDGYNPALENITAATVSLDLRDDKGYFLSYDIFWEKARLSSGGTIIDTWEVDTGTEVLTITSLTELNNSGILSLTLKAVLGDFYFDQATLNAQAVSTIPVPAAVWLFGSGLLGLAGFARAKQRA
jgi:hypothetical protein